MHALYLSTVLYDKATCGNAEMASVAFLIATHGHEHCALYSGLISEVEEAGQTKFT